MPADEELTQNVTGTASRIPAGSKLVVFGDGLLEEHPLPTKGAIVLGRSADAGICVEHPSVSRKHARLTMGPPLTIADLGSHNGTRVRGERVAQGQDVPVRPGEPFSIGKITVLVRAGADKTAPRFVGMDFLETKAGELLSEGVRPIVLLVEVDAAAPIDFVDRAVASAVGHAPIATPSPRSYAVLVTSVAELDAMKAALRDVALRAGTLRVRSASGRAGDTAARLLSRAREAAPDEHASSTDAHEEAAFAMRCVVALYAQGRVEEARAIAASARFADLPAVFAAMCAGSMAAAAHEAGQLDDARSLYASAIEAQRRAKSVRGEATALLGAASCDAVRGAAKETYARCAEMFRSLGDADAEAFASSCARAASSRDLGRVAERALGGKGAIARYARLLATSLAGTERQGARPKLVFDAAKRSVKAPDAAIDLSRRRVLWTLLDALASAHDEQPDRPVARDALFAAVWPGERVHPEAATNRIHVAVATLRKLGLRDLIVSRDDGYLLEPRCTITRA